MTTAFVQGTSGDWMQYDPDDVVAEIYELAGNSDLESALSFNKEATRQFHSQQLNILSIVDVEQSATDSPVLSRLKEEIENLSILTQDNVIKASLPGGQKVTRDALASGQGYKVPPHISVLSQVVEILHTLRIVEDLAHLSRQTANHVSRQQRQRRNASAGTKVFIGHGRSPVWRELKEFVEERLKLPADEFNRVPVAGVSNKERLQELLDEASISFLILTGEDEQADGQFNPRMNVVHEAGLFQGRLGFERAIILLEDGCENFSNVHGLGHIPFPRDSIKTAFEEIRRVCEREGLL